jgi:D-alanyl-D-alanine carboxypeptidase/D-alanyl-D-alanine-endopeptidase (penicillin-binding protein 4)
MKESNEPLQTAVKEVAGASKIVEPGASETAVPATSGEGKTLATHTSVSLMEDMVVTNKVSQNLHAELFLHQVGARGGRDGSTAQGARVVRSFLQGAGIDKDDFVFFDGSGLSGHDLVAPRATARLLQYASTQPWFADWRRTLPEGGEDGSLAERFAKAPLKDHVFAKTGTLSEARALSGYLDCASGRTVIFSIMVGNHTPRSNVDRDVMDKIVAAIAAAN